MAGILRFLAGGPGAHALLRGAMRSQNGVRSVTAVSTRRQREGSPNSVCVSDKVKGTLCGNQQNLFQYREHQKAKE
jgi:hypothetical protein